MAPSRVLEEQLIDQLIETEIQRKLNVKAGKKTSKTSWLWQVKYNDKIWHQQQLKSDVFSSV